MRVLLNGEERDFRGVTSLRDLLRELGIPPLRVAVERNEELVPRTEYDATLLQDDDRLEIVTFVGGG
ncbi:MAG TPA: sulfur carrier protein ThiS [Phycisphaerae bacterium]|jgi:thiamine biosynthesis protein ThiS